MESKLVIYNTLTRQKERFEPLHAPKKVKWNQNWLFIIR